MVVQSEWPSRVTWLNCWNLKVKRTLHQKISQNTRDESQSSAFVGQSGNVASISRTDRVVESADDRTRLLHKSVCLITQCQVDRGDVAVAERCTLLINFTAASCAWTERRVGGEASTST